MGKIFKAYYQAKDDERNRTAVRINQKTALKAFPIIPNPGSCSVMS